MATHPKAKGDLSTLAIMAVLQDAGYGVYTPFGENTRCDLVIERAGGLRRVQCKTGAFRAGAVVFSVCSSYGHHRNPQTARRSYVGQVASDYAIGRVTIEGLRAPSGA